MRLCSPHLNGVAPGTPPFFDPRCQACQAKLRLGLVTGKEPAAPRFHLRYKRWGTMYAKAPKRRMSP